MLVRPLAIDAVPLAEVVALGALHGACELVPVSSSAHAALVPWLARWDVARLGGEDAKALAVALHAGSAVALAWAWREDALAAARAPGFSLAATAIPVAVGLALGDRVKRHLGGPATTAAGLAAGALASLAAGGSSRGGSSATRAATSIDGVAIGLAQAAALWPGVSRTGAAIAAARARGHAPDQAAALARQAALPVLIGATLHEAALLLRRETTRTHVTKLVVGACASGAVTRLAAAPAGSAAERQTPWALERLALATLTVRRLRQARTR